MVKGRHRKHFQFICAFNFDHFKFDASTLNPYMGQDSLEPFLSYRINSIYSCADFKSWFKWFSKQRLMSGGFLYQEVTKRIHSWNKTETAESSLAQPIWRAQRKLESHWLSASLIPELCAGGSLEDVQNYYSLKRNFLPYKCQQGYNSKKSEWRLCRCRQKWISCSE